MTRMAREITEHDRANAKRLREVWHAKKKELGLTQQKAGDQMGGITQGAVGQYLRGEIALGTEAILKFAKVLQVDPRAIDPEFAYLDSSHITPVEPGPDLNNGVTLVPLVGTAQLGPDGSWSEMEYPVGHGDGYISAPTTDPNAYSLRVRGDSMYPAIRDGWVVVCEPNRPLVPGEYVLIKLNDGQCMVKELLFEKPDAMHVVSVNDAYGRLTLPLEKIDKAHHVAFVVPPSKLRL